MRGLPMSVKPVMGLCRWGLIGPKLTFSCNVLVLCACAIFPCLICLKGIFLVWSAGCRTFCVVRSEGAGVVNAGCPGDAGVPLRHGRQYPSGVPGFRLGVGVVVWLVCGEAACSTVLHAWSCGEVVAPMCPLCGA